MNKASINVDFFRTDTVSESDLVDCMPTIYVNTVKLARILIKNMLLWHTSRSLKLSTAIPSTCLPTGFGGGKQDLVSDPPATTLQKSALHFRRSQPLGSVSSSAGRPSSYRMATPSTGADSSVRSSSMVATWPLTFPGIASESERSGSLFNISIHENLRFRQPQRPHESALLAADGGSLSPISHGIA